MIVGGEGLQSVKTKALNFSFIQRETFRFSPKKNNKNLVQKENYLQPISRATCNLLELIRRPKER